MVTLANFDLQFLNNVITCIIKLMVTLANFDLQFLNNVITCTCIIKTNGDLSQFCISCFNPLIVLLSTTIKLSGFAIF